MTVIFVIFQAKEKLEESGSKPKHVLSNRGTQTESSKPSEGMYHSGHVTVFDSRTCSRQTRIVCYFPLNEELL